MSALPPIHVRPARERDLSCLAVLATQVFLDTYAVTGIRQAIADEALRSFSVPTFKALLASEDTFIWLAEVQYHLVGFGQVTVGRGQALVQAKKPAELDRLYVQEPFTHRGIGSRLLKRAEEEACQRGATALWLTPWVHNVRARQFYRKHGYVDVGATFFRMDDERHENRVVVKPLADESG
jgi:GNAT superfamily N-acetyltransferase